MAEMIDEVVYLFNISTTLAHFRFSFFLHVWATNKMLLYLSNEWPDVLIGPVSFFYFFRFPLPFFFSLTLRCGRPFLFWKGGKKAAQEGGVGSKSFDVAYCSSRLGNSKKGRYTHTHTQVDVACPCWPRKWPVDCCVYVSFLQCSLMLLLVD